MFSPTRKTRSLSSKTALFKNKFFLYGLTALSSVAFMPTSSQAAGFYLQEQSVSGLGAAFAGQVASPRDSSIVYFNPAGMTYLDGTHVHVGVHVLAPDAELDDTGTTVPFGAAVGGDGGNPYGVTPLPNIHMSHEAIDDTLWLGFSVSAPFGLGNEYDDDFFGRFDSTETELTTYDIQPSFAVRVNDKLSLGGGLNIQYADAELKRIVNPFGTGEFVSVLDGDDFSFGFNLGLMYQHSEDTRFGVHYRSRVNHTLKGETSTETLGGMAFGTPNSARADLDLPDIAQFGVNHKLNDKVTLLASATWFGWDSFNEIRVINDAGSVVSLTPQDYQNTWAFAIGAEYELNDKWTLRAGYQFDETPTTDEFRTTLTPDGDRNWIAAGATYDINEKFSLDLAATYIDVGDETIDLTRTVGGGTSNISADSSGDVMIFAAGLNYKF